MLINSTLSNHFISFCIPKDSEEWFAQSEDFREIYSSSKIKDMTMQS